MRISAWQSTALALGLFSGLGAALPFARAEASKTGTIEPREVHEGMKGFGLTVFKGTRPERFDVEVVGVLHNFRPGQELIVIRTPHPRLDVVKTVRGMSGSPVFLDGRLAGAYAYSLSNFEAEPIAGVTPISLMLGEMRRPVPPGFWPLAPRNILPGGARYSKAAAPPEVGGERRYSGPPGQFDLTAYAKELGAGLNGDASNLAVRPAATPLLTSGIGERSVAALRTLFEPLGLEPLQGGGGDGPSDGAPEHYENGGALGVEMMRGDVSMMGLGTTTFAQGGRVLGFGHPMLNGGDSALPACIGRVLWINASFQASHKVGECARPLGTLVQDRQSAIVVDESVEAPTIPLHVKLQGIVGAPKSDWRAELTPDRFLAPSLVASALGSAVEAAVSERREMSWRLESDITIDGHSPLHLVDFGVSVGGTPDAGEWQHSRLVTALGSVLNNPWEHPRVQKIEATLTVTYAHEAVKLRGMTLLDPVVEPGGTARLRLRLVPFIGKELHPVVTVRLPPELEGKDVEIEVLPGYEVTAELPPPDSLEQLLSNERYIPAPDKSVVLQLKLPSQGVAFSGHVANRLPSSILDTIRTQSSDVGPEGFQSFSRTIAPLDVYLEGRDKVKVHVRAPGR